MSVHELPTETITDEDVETGDAQEARPSAFCRIW